MSAAVVSARPKTTIALPMLILCVLWMVIANATVGGDWIHGRRSLHLPHGDPCRAREMGISHNLKPFQYSPFVASFGAVLGDVVLTSEAQLQHPWVWSIRGLFKRAQETRGQDTAWQNRGRGRR